MTEKKILPNGTWPSPISAALISQRLRLEDVKWAADGETIVWAESRSGGTVLVAQKASQARRDLTDIHSLRGGVGYGGGSFDVSTKNDLVVFANRDGRLYRRGLGLGQPLPITPSFNAPASGVAAPSISPDGKLVAYVYSDGKLDCLGLVSSSGEEWPIKLRSGADFYMQPVWHPDGSRLAWVEWDKPNMPWDGTRIQLAHLASNPYRVVDIQTVGGGSEKPAQQPLFSPDGMWLCFIEENGEWPDLVLLNLQSGERRVLIAGDNFEISLPAWVQGIRTMAWSHDSRHLYHLRLVGPDSSLWVIDIETGLFTQIDAGEFTALAQPGANPLKNELTFFAAAPGHPQSLVKWDGGNLTILANTIPATYDPTYLSVPHHITWETSDGEQSYGLYYPPTNPSFEGIGAPPAILHIHGGPTSQAANSFNPEAAYFASRGYAWIEVNYRGSTGYGRRYRHALRQRWGDVDVEDTAACARALANQGLANPKQLVILGGSAGGFTVLNALERYPGLFKAGVCLYGVTNLFSLDMDTHKFEAHYNATLVGSLPESAERYHAWSPVFHADKIQDALYIFQGSEDNVVPPSQADEIITALRNRGTVYKYKLYQGEGHGFRGAETIADYLKETERFLQQQVIFAP